MKTWDGLPVAPDRPYACCVVVWREGFTHREFLVLHRVAAARHAGLENEWAWTPPSGARLPGERPDAAAARELREETGLTLPFTPVPGAPSEDVALYVAEAPPDAGVVLDREHDEFAWLPLEDAAPKCLPPSVGACLINASAWLSTPPGRFDIRGE